MTASTASVTNKVRAEPIVLLSLVEHDLQRPMPSTSRPIPQ